MTNSHKPIRNPQIMMQQLKHETMLYNTEAEEVHILNPTAKVIWELSDGTHTIKEMAEAMQQAVKKGYSPKLHQEQISPEEIYSI